MGADEGSAKMRRFIVLVVVVGVVMAIAAPAFAGKVYKETIRFRDSVEEVVPAGEICEFEVGISEDVKVSDTAWFDSEGTLLKAHITVNGTTVWSGPGGSAIEHWAYSGWFDPVALTFSEAGNKWNVHLNGLVLHDKGLVVFDATNGDVIKVAGPHQALTDGLGALCEAIG
jgi:hypothetical protein